MSLCITTMNRFKSHLSKYLPKLLEYEVFSEVIIVDENGLDKYQLDQAFGSNPKVKIYTNDARLGAFRNKLKAMSLATNDWVFLLDSDNFIGPDFAKALAAFPTDLDPRRIYCPEMALINWKPNPAGTYSGLKGRVIDKPFIKSNFMQLEFFLNMGNYVIHKPTVMAFDFGQWDGLINLSKCYDTILFAYLMVYHHDMGLEIMPGFRLIYAVHEDNYFLPNHRLPEVAEFYAGLRGRLATD